MPTAIKRHIAGCRGASLLAWAAAWAAAPAFGQEGLPAPGGYRAPSAESIAPPAGSGAATAPQSQADLTPAEIVAEVRIVGNDTITPAQVSGHLMTRAGRPFDRSVVQKDVRTLANLNWFVDVKPLYESTPRGTVVIFQVVERPTIRYVTYLGNKKVRDKTLAKQTLLKAGGSVDPYAVEEGRRKLHDYYVGRGFNNAQITILEGNKLTDQGVVYLIHEDQAQRVWDVEFEGNEFVSAARLKTLVKSKPPILMLFKGYVDREKIDADKNVLTAYYRSFGFFQARISPHYAFNDKGNWLTITWIIHEGPRYQVRDVRLLGVSKFDPVAMVDKTKLKAGQPFEQSAMQTDSQWIQDLYGSHGYIFADIRPETIFLEEPGQVDLVYHVEEGQRWRVGRIFVHIGGDNPHTRIQTALNRVTLVPGQIFDIRELKASERRLMASSLFHVDAATGQRPKITYRIPEDADLDFAERGRNGLRGQNPIDAGPPVLAPPSMMRTGEALPPARAKTVPGASDLHVFCEDENAFLIWLATENALNAIDGSSHAIQNDRPTSPAGGAPPMENGGAPHQQDAPSQPAAVQDIIRGQSPEPPPASGNWLPGWRNPAQNAPANPYAQFRGQSPQSPQNPAYAALGAASPAAGAGAAGYVNQAYAAVPAGQGSGYGGQIVRATGPESVQAGAAGIQPAQYSPQLQPPAGSIAPTPLNTQGPLPGFSVDPVPPTYAVPYGTMPSYPEGLVDVYIEGSETQTGRLMVGVGVNSDAGVVGNFVIDERNFDWARWPDSFEDIRNGSAFRGDSQRLRIDASPGSQVSRYLVSFQDPYWFDRPISLGLSGSYYDRRFQDWDEQRLGGRVSLGYQWVERDLSATVAYRGENVNIHDPSVPLGVVPELDEVLGDNSLHGFKLTVIRDTRDNPFLATQGTYFEIGGEQVIGSFDYPRVDMDIRKYWLLYERPDHSGRHVLGLSSTVGYSGTHTPIYEHYFAGGFATLRGFDFRGASPVDQGVQVGGEFQWLSSAQYMFPITADEMLHGVVFCDFGTVEREVTINDFRVAPGLGLRITVPAMGPAPIALDFAFPVSDADTDDRQIFSFSLGFSR